MPLGVTTDLPCPSRFPSNPRPATSFFHVNRDVEKNEAVTSFIDHGGDVMSLSVLPSVNRNMFVSGSCDATAKVRRFLSSLVSCLCVRDSSSASSHLFASARGCTPNFGLRLPLHLSPFSSPQLPKTHHPPLCFQVWDIRQGKCVQTFAGHESDVNSVTLFPDGNAFGSGACSYPHHLSFSAPILLSLVGHFGFATSSSCAAA